MDLTRNVVAAFSAMTMAAACHRSPQTRAAIPTAPAQQPAADPPAARSLPTEIDRLRNEGAVRIRATTEALLIPVHFSFDDYDLDEHAREILDQKLQILAANASIAILATGHADDRGSDEYNIALGQRRAAAIKRYLTQNGIDAARITTGTVGEERPLCTEATESCRARNRRVDFSIVRGAIASPLQ